MAAASKSIWLLIAGTLQQSAPAPHEHFSFSIIFAFWQLALFTLAASYTGSLISFLTARSFQKLPFNDFKSFADALMDGKIRLIGERKKCFNLL